ADTISRTSNYPGGEDVAKFFQNYLDAVGKITKEDIQRVAKKYLARKDASIVWSIPKEEPKGPEEKKGGGRRIAFDLTPQPPSLGGKGEPDLPGVFSPFPPREGGWGVRSLRAEGAGTGGFTLGAAKKVVLPNGLTVILLEDHRLPIVV